VSLRCAVKIFIIGDGESEEVICCWYSYCMHLLECACRILCEKQNSLKDRDNAKQTFISFAINKVEDLKNGYDADIMEALISNVYAAVQFTDDSDLNTALHELWNALIFNGENIVGKEDDLIKALKDIDSSVIEGIAYSIRQVN